MSSQPEAIHNIPKIGFGTARLGGRIIPNRSRETSWLSILNTAFDSGYTYFDTAELYALGYSEELLGRAYRQSNKSRAEIIVSTKAWLNHLSFNSLLRACEHSLRRLKMESIDLYLIHIPNPLIPLKETFRALNLLVHQKKVKHIGVSNFNQKILMEAMDLADFPILTNQIRFNILDKACIENGLLEFCQNNNILVTAYSPLRCTTIFKNETILSISKNHQATPQQIALAWLISHPKVITIPMSFNKTHQRENLEAANIKLSKIEIDQINLI